MLDYRRSQGFKIGEGIKVEMHIPFSLEWDRHEFPSEGLRHIRRNMSKLMLGKYLVGQENHAHRPVTYQSLQIAGLGNQSIAHNIQTKLGSDQT